MPLRIFNNLNSSIAQNRLEVNNRNLGEAIGKVASGNRLIGTGVNAAERSVSELLNSDARALRQRPLHNPRFFVTLFLRMTKQPCIVILNAVKNLAFLFFSTYAKVSLRQGEKNLNDGIGLINIAEGALNEQTGILIRLKEVFSNGRWSLISNSTGHSAA